jgi:hypothetical protein
MRRDLEAVDQGQPCPECGGLSRHLALSGVGACYSSGRAFLNTRHRGRRPNGRKAFDLIQGISYHRSSGTWNTMYRLVDWEHDWYEERFTAQDGSVIRDIREPPSAHRDHGDAGKRGRLKLPAQRTSRV